MKRIAATRGQLSRESFDSLVAPSLSRCDFERMDIPPTHLNVVLWPACIRGNILLKKERSETLYAFLPFRWRVNPVEQHGWFATSPSFVGA